MSRIRFDQLAKQYLEEFLEPLGTVQRNWEVPGESKFVDVWFTPASSAVEPPINLGLLGRIATTPCLLEPFRKAPTRQEIRSCLLKLLWIQEDQRRRLEQEGGTQKEDDLPKLWLLAATVTKPAVIAFGGQPRSDDMLGMYFLPEAHKTAIIAIDELPQTQETLWLRILGRDDAQQQAISELLALPADDRRRTRALQLLVAWKITIEVSGTIDTEESGLMAVLSQAYLEWERQTVQRGIEQGIEQGIERGIEQGIEQGIERGSQREARALVVRLLVRKLGELPESTQSPIETLSLTQLEDLGEALLEFGSLSDLAAWLAAQAQ